ncbi:MAG: hypothetical protein WD000_02270 [Thermodesulfobacteriota bacterium]
MTNYHDEIDNIKLIRNGLMHLECELLQDDPSWHRIAREAHLVLYRSMIEALRSTDNIAITGKKSKNRVHVYKIGVKPWKKIEKISVDGCENAWKFSIPESFEPENDTHTTESLSDDRLMDDFLVPFYDALAMIQAENFMETLVHSKKVAVSDEDMQKLELLHESVRNPYEHFVPCTRLTPKRLLCSVAKLCISLSRELLFESGNVHFYIETEKEDIANFINQISSKLECN